MGRSLLQNGVTALVGGLGEGDIDPVIDKGLGVAAVPGINCLFIGSGDLRERLVIRESNGMSVNDAAVHVARMAREYKVAWGIAVRSIEDLSQYHRLGAQLIPWGGDFLLTGMLENCKKELDSALSHLP